MLLKYGLNLSLFRVVWITSSLFFSVIAEASPNAEKQKIACQKAKKNMQSHFKKVKTIHDDVVVFSKIDNLSRTKTDLAHLGIKHELLALAKKDMLHACHFNNLASTGLSVSVADDGQFYIYHWATDYELPDNKGYTYIMYAQPKSADFQSAQLNESHYGELSQLITIPQPIKASDTSDEDFPIYAVVTHHFLRGQHRIHCQPIVSFFYVKQDKNAGTIAKKELRFLDVQGKPIQVPYSFIGGCNSDDPETKYKMDNQFDYDADSQVLSFDLPKQVGFIKEALSERYTYIPYRFIFNGKDFVQIPIEKNTQK